MAYKKTSPSLQDSIEVFTDQVQSIHSTSKLLSEKSDSITEALANAERIRIKPDLKELDNKLSQLQGFSNQLNVILNSQKTDFQNLLKKSSSVSLYNFGSIAICLLVIVSMMFFGIKTKSSQSNLENKIQELESYSKSLESYIKDSKQIDQYNKWLSKKNKK